MVDDVDIFNIFSEHFLFILLQIKWLQNDSVKNYSS